MANRIREEEKNEKIIRGLLKLPENRRCINCNSLGPQYVCTNFWTFICTTCSGIHREYTHRVKSISMAKFASEEVNALQNGGNERARKFFLKEWDPSRHYFPDSSNIERLRDFIRHVYVDRRFSGDRNSSREDLSGDSRKLENFRGGSRSPSYGDAYESHVSERNRYTYDERRSPGYERDYHRSPRHFEIVDDRVRGDRFSKGPKGGRLEDQIPNGAHHLEGRSPNNQKVPGLPSPPMVRPVREILGENVPPLQVGELRKTSSGRSESSFNEQRSPSAGSLVSADGSSSELKRVTSGSLIDLNIDSEPADSFGLGSGPSSSMSGGLQAAVVPSADGNNWASFTAPEEAQASASMLSAQSVECQLSLLSVPAIAAGGVAAQPHASSISTFQTTFLQTSAVDSQLERPNSLPVQPHRLQAQQLGHENLFARSTSFAPHALELQTQQSQMLQASIQQAHQPPQSVQLSTQPSPQHHGEMLQSLQGQHQFQKLVSPPETTFAGASNNQIWNSSVSPNFQVSTASSSQVSQGPNPVVEASNVSSNHASASADTKLSGRKELPEGLFSANYPPTLVPVQNWPAAFPHGIGYNSPYHVGMPPVMLPSKSSNPFDLSPESAPNRVSMFPSMQSLQQVLPNIPVQTPPLAISSLGASSQWVGPQSPSYQTTLPSGYGISQVQSSMLPLGVQGIGGSSSSPTFGSTMINTQLHAAYSRSSALNYAPQGNPFS